MKDRSCWRSKEEDVSRAIDQTIGVQIGVGLRGAARRILILTCWSPDDLESRELLVVM